MVKTTVQYFCDACGKDISDEYAGSIKILIVNDKVDEIDPEGNMFCADCMRSFNEWKKSRRNKNV